MNVHSIHRSVQSSGRASPGEKRKCSEARAESSQPGATVIVVSMGAGAAEASTSHSPHGSPKGAELKRPKSGVDLASLGGEGQGGEGQGGEAPASGESKAPLDNRLVPMAPTAVWAPSATRVDSW